MQLANEIFTDSYVQITSTGERHLGAVIGDKSYKTEYVQSKVDSWIDQLTILSKISETEPQAAYAAFVGGFKSKLNYFMRTIPEITEMLTPVEEIIRFKLIPALTGGHQCSDNDHDLLSLPTRYGGLGLTIFPNLSSEEYNNSRKITTKLMTSIKIQITTSTL